MSSMVGRGKWLLFSALFSGLGSMQILGFPFGFVTETIPLIQSVLRSTGAIIPLASSSFSSSLSGAIIATGTLRLGSFTGGTLLSISILYSPSKQPTPVKTSPNSVFIVSIFISSSLSLILSPGLCFVTMLSIARMFSYCTLISFIASLAFLPSKGILSF